MNEQLNAKTASFVMTILQMEKPKYSYGRKPKCNKVFDTIISLPATPSDEPDWKYMEDFMGGAAFRAFENFRQVFAHSFGNGEMGRV